MAEVQNDINRNVQNILNAPYAKDVIDEIANGIEKCYDRILEDPDRSEFVDLIESGNELIKQVDDTVADMASLQDAIIGLNNSILVDDNRVDNPGNKILIKARSNTERRVASFSSYESLWTLVNNMNNVYCDGHGGVVSIVEDEEYIDISEADVFEKNRKIHRYYVDFSDGYRSDFLIVGSLGPTDMLQTNGTVIEYAKGVFDESGDLVKDPPIAKKWETNIPNLSPGDYLWSRTTSILKSGGISTLYAIGRIGFNGESFVNSVQLGSGSAMTDDVVVNVDSLPASGHSMAAISSEGVKLAINNFKNNTQFTGLPTVATPSIKSPASSIVNVEFIKSVVDDNANAQKIMFNELLNNTHFTGTPTAPTYMSPGGDSTIATTHAVRYMYTELLRGPRTNSQVTARGTIGDVLKSKFFRISRLSSEVSDTTKRININIPAATTHMIFVSSPVSICNASFIAYGVWRDENSLSALVSVIAKEEGITSISRPDSNVVRISFSNDAVALLAGKEVQILDFILFANTSSSFGRPIYTSPIAGKVTIA